MERVVLLGLGWALGVGLLRAWRLGWGVGLRAWRLGLGVGLFRGVKLGLGVGFRVASGGDLHYLIVRK